MELERIEFTMEDVLAIHRGWIEQLYLQDLKSEAEIVELLSQQRLIVTVNQVQKCIREWNLQQRPFMSIPGLDDFLSLRSSLISVPYPRNSTITSSHSRTHSTSISPLRMTRNTPSSEHNITYASQEEYYANRQLPPIPLPTDDPTLRRDRRARITQPRTGRQCTHGHEPHECWEARYLLNTLPQGPSSIRVYSDTEEIHERLAIGLPGSRGRPGQLVSSSSEARESKDVASPVLKATAVNKDKIAFTPIADVGINLEVDSQCESSSDEVIELKFVRAKDMAMKGGRTDKMQSVRVHYGDQKAARRVSFMGKGDGVEGDGVQDRKRKRRDSPQSMNAKEMYKKDRS